MVKLLIFNCVVYYNRAQEQPPNKSYKFALGGERTFYVFTTLDFLRNLQMSLICRSVTLLT